MTEQNHQIDIDRIPEDEREIEIDLLDLFSYYRSRLKWILGAFILGALLAALVTQFVITPKYTATSTMYMVSSSSGSAIDLSELTMGTSLSSDYVELIKTRPIIEDVIREQKLDYSYEDMLGMLDLSAVADTRILKINVTSADKKEAANIANSLALKAEKELPKLMDAPKPHIAERAVIPDHKSSPSIMKNTLIGALIMLLMVLVVLTAMYLMDDTIKSSEDLEKYFGIMPLTVIPEGQIEGLQADEEEEQASGRKIRKKKRRQ